MINEKSAKSYCCEDISLIENYTEAVVDSKMWDIHHRAETDEVLTRKELIAQGRYWKRPASELIFLTRAAHRKLHFDCGTMEKQRKVLAENGRKTGAETGRKYGATNGRKCSKKVYQYSLDGTFIREWASLSEIKRQLKFDQGHICDCCNGKRKSAYCYIWRYA